MDLEKTINIVRGDTKACAESLLRAVEICDTPEELDHLNAVLQAARQTLQGAVFLIGKAINGNNQT